MPKDDTPRPDQGATIEDAFSAALTEEFEIFTSDPHTRRALRGSIAGKVKRRTLMHLAFLQGVKVGAKASDFMHAAQLAVALGLPVDTAWSELLARVRAAHAPNEPSRGSTCNEPDCVNGYVHEDGEVSLCWSCPGEGGGS